MSSSPSDLVRRWPTLVAILSTRKLRTPDLRNLLELVLSDGDDPTEAELTGKEETQTPSPRLTPVERLLLLLTQVDLSFRRKLVDLEPTDDDNRKYWQALTYLKRLLVMSLSQATPARALSDVERTRLYAQLTSVSFHCARLNPIRGRWRRSTRLISEHHLDALGSRLERLPSADRDVEQLKTLWLYRKARAIVRSAPENASALLASLFQRSGGVVPKGIFFHASRALFDLPPSRRKDVLAQSRVAIATTFARLGVRRVLDRIALLICLVQDAIYADAADTADALYDAEREFSSAMFTDLSFVAPHARSELNRLRHDVFSQLDAMPRPVCADTDMGRLYAALPRRLRGDFEKSGRHIPEGWETFEPGDDVPLRLYYQVLTLWLKRRHGVGVTQGELDAFWSTALAALQTYRNDHGVMTLVRSGAWIRYVVLRTHEHIDGTLSAFDDLLALGVLRGEWQAVIDGLSGETHLKFLAEKLGLTRESETLKDLTLLFETVFKLHATPERLRHDNDLGETLTGVARTEHPEPLDVHEIGTRWKWSAELADGANQISVEQWAKFYRGAPHTFVRQSEDEWVRLWFLDADEALRVSSNVGSLPCVERGRVLSSLAWAAFVIGRVLQTVEKKGSIADRPGGLSWKGWRSKGIGWAEQALEIATRSLETNLQYRTLEVRSRLERLEHRNHDMRCVQRLRSRMLQLDNRRLTTSSTPGRRQRSILKAERSYCERLGDKWAKDITGWVRMDSQNIREPLDQLQELKLFNFGQLLPDVQEDESTSSEDRADELLEPLSAAQDVMDRVETYADVRLDRAGQIELWRHLKSTGAAILDFVTHPDGRLQQGHGNLERGWGTLCFAIRAGDQFLEARPFHLRVPDAWIRLMVDGDPSDVSSGAPYCGFKSDLVPWSFASDGPLPESIVSLGAELFPPEMLEALNGIRRLYVCPHRHLFQIPIHALPVRGKPLYEQFDVSYAMKTVHVVDLLRHRTGQNAATRLWLIDTKDDSVSSELLLRRFNASNSWANAGLSAEGLLRDGAVAHQTVMCCHGQMDEARGGRARLRLWGGGRLVADDIHRVSHVSARQNGYQPVDFSTSDWVIAACDAGASRIAMETAPGISLSLVSCGARNVTSSMFRVTPSTAHRFVRYYLEARDEDRPAAFSTACRRVGSRTRQSWAQAASFVSYGLFAKS